LRKDEEKIEKIPYKKPEINEVWNEDIGSLGIYLLEM
jgi:hypothetical protein